jgi:hypothetical protein
VQKSLTVEQDVYAPHGSVVSAPQNPIPIPIATRQTHACVASTSSPAAF